MPTTVWIAAALVASAVPGLWWSFNQTQAVSARAVENLGRARPTSLRGAQLNQPVAERIGLPIVSGLGRAFNTFLPTEWLRRYERNLGRAGKVGRWSAEQVVGAKFALLIFSSCAYSVPYLFLSRCL